MLKVRDLHSNDKKEWLELWDGYLKLYKTDLSIEQTELTWNRLLDKNYNSFCLVADLDGKVLGIANYSFQTSTWSQNNYCYLEDLFVKNDIRRSGVGGALIEAVKQIAKDSGSTRLYWNTDKNNEIARNLYDKFASEAGFVQYRVQLEL